MAEPITDEKLAEIERLANLPKYEMEYLEVRRKDLKEIFARLTAERERAEKAERNCDCKALETLAGTVGMKFVSYKSRAEAAEAKLTAAEAEAARLRELLDCARDEFEVMNGQITDPTDPHWSVQARPNTEQEG